MQNTTDTRLKQIDGEELKKVQLQILEVVAKFCEENQINYWLDFGTLIGAVRHKGYIPWDDDIDISMLREDYDKFMQLFNLRNERYKFYSYENDKNFYYPYGKVLDTQTVLYEPDESGSKISINIDIFVYDNAPSNAKTVKKMYKKRDKYNICEVANKHSGAAKGNLLRRMAVAFLKGYVKMFPRDYFVKKMVKNAKRYSQTNTEYVGDFMGSLTYFKCEKSVFDKFIDAEFEGSKFKIPVGYDKLLRMVYGDYMQLPPEEQRVSHHKYKAFIAEN